MGKTSVSIIYNILTLSLVGWTVYCQNSDYLAHLGIRETDYGIGYQFRYMYKVQIELRLNQLVTVETK